MIINRKLMAALGTVALLAACGGGDDNPPAATAQVPASASATSAGFISYLQTLVASSADTLQPVDISNVTPPLDDTGSPTSVN